MSKRFVPAIVLAVFVAYLAVLAIGLPVRAVSGFDLSAFRRLPVSVSGRVQPIDSVARLALLRITGSDAASAMPNSTEWLLEVLAKPDAADGRKIFPVEERELAKKLSLSPATRGTAYYAFRDFAAKVSDVARQAERVSKMRSADRQPWERELLLLQARLVLYERLKNSLQPNSALQRDAKGQPIAFDFANALRGYRADLSEAVRVAERRREGGTDVLDATTELRLRAFAGLFQHVSRVGLLAVVPPVRGAEPRAGWGTTGGAIVSSAEGRGLTAAVGYFAAMSSAFAHGKVGPFNDAVAGYQRWLLANGLAAAVSRGRLEVFYNDFQPSARAAGFYTAALVLLLVAWGTRSTMVYRSAVVLVLLAFVMQGAGLAFTFKLAGRPLAVAMAAWAASLTGLVAEWFWRRRIAIAAAAATALTILAITAPGGRMTLVRTALDSGLLIAAAVVAGALAVAGVAARSSEPAGAGLRDRLSSGYFAVRRALRAQ